jgi:hypothetical protein
VKVTVFTAIWGGNKIHGDRQVMIDDVSKYSDYCFIARTGIIKQEFIFIEVKVQ